MKEVPATRSALATFCDDVRLEVGNKMSYVGIYQGTLLLTSLPTTLPKLCVVITARTPHSNPFRELKFELFRGNDELLLSQVLPDVPPVQSPSLESLEYKGGERIDSYTTIMQLVGFPVTSDLMLRTVVTTEGEMYRAGSLAIQRLPDQPEPTAPPDVSRVAKV